MNTYTKANRLRLFFHCLFHFHRSYWYKPGLHGDGQGTGEEVWIGCLDCKWKPKTSEPILTEAERKALTGLNQYGPAEDCRQSNETVEAYATLEKRELVFRTNGETYITHDGRKALENARELSS